MRILQLRFKNLNSLMGEWSIDFTDPAYVADGIFAITGPTGSGKTTILDAMCLALYGRTPRLASINQSGNEIMSRLTGECFAEAVFETGGGRFRSFWGQRRAGKKPDGNLQPQQVEIADLDSGKILETKIKDAAGRIKEITGMDFEQFTRSRLLAQGDFAAFLNAEAKDKGPHLEKITGTRIYSELSRLAHVRCSEERKKLEAAEAACGNIAILSAEEKREIKENLASREKEITTLGAALAGYNSQLFWLQGLKQLEAERAALSVEMEKHEQAQAAFLPEREKLLRGGEALELEGDFSALNALKRERDKLQKEYESLANKKPEAQKKLEAAEKAEKEAATQRDAAKKAMNEAQPLIRKARELDLKIAENGKALEKAGSGQAEASGQLAKLGAEKEAAEKSLQNGRERLSALLAKMDEFPADALLAEKIGELRANHKNFISLSAQVDEKSAEKVQAEKLFAQAVNDEEQHRERLVLARETHTENLNAREAAQTGLAGLLEGKSVSQLNAKREELFSIKAELAKSLEAVTKIKESTERINECSRRIGELSQKREALSKQLDTWEREQTTLEEKLPALEKAHYHASQVGALVEHRLLLEDGFPCPLCGSSEHPYAANLPAGQANDVESTTRDELAKANQMLKELAKKTAEGRIEQARLEKDLEQAKADKAVAENNREAYRKLIESTSPALSSMGASHEENFALVEDSLLKICEENNAGLDEISRRLEAVEGFEKKLAVTRQAAEESAIILAGVEEKTRSAEAIKRRLEQQCQALRNEETSRKSAARESFEELRSGLAVFCAKQPSLENLAFIMKDLQQRLECRQAATVEKERLERELSGTATAIEIIIAKMEQLAAIEKEQAQACESLAATREELLKEREEIFMAGDPDEAETALAAAVSRAESLYSSAWQSARESKNIAEQIENNLRELFDKLALVGGELAAAQERLALRLHTAGFADEDAFVAARLTGEERAALAARSRELEEGGVRLKGRLSDVQRSIETERAKELTALPEDSLRAAVEDNTALQQAMQRETGALRLRLEENEKQEALRQESVKEVLAQRKELERWANLDQLIGSADGSKYRNFAQELTFEALLSHANLQLYQLTDRYILRRDPPRPLSLKIIDNYQGGVERTIKNLSGGESFIVSLALALALSRMTAGKASLDSLFLDEGFGALDEDSLDTALSALSGLSRTGKLIGIISHIQALKERIATQIQVTPQAGGRSVLQGPGCSLL